MGNSPIYITPQLLIELSATADKLHLVDVRKRPAFESSGQMISRAVWRDHEAVDLWGAAFAADARVIAYCVHGHEVSQNVVASLLSQGIDACYLQGGFDAWLGARGDVTKLTDLADNSGGKYGSK